MSASSHLALVYELLQLIQKNSASAFFDKPYINVLIDTYSNDYVKNMTDSKYGKVLLLIL